MKQSFYTYLFLCFAIGISLTSNAQTSITVSIDAATGKPVITKKGGESQVTNKALTATPCSITAIGFAASYTINTACPGERLFLASFGITITGEPESCTEIANHPLWLELSNGTGDFTSPMILFEGGIFQVAEALYGSEFPLAEGDNSYSLPSSLAPGTNYLLRIRAKDTGLVSLSTVGPFTVPEPTTTSIASLAANETTCPVQVQGQAFGSTMILTGPNGYVFSYVFRDEQSAALSFPVDKPGTYLLKNVTSASLCPAIQTVTVTKSCP